MEIDKTIEAKMEQCKESCIRFVQKQEPSELSQLMLRWLTILAETEEAETIAVYQMALLGLWQSWEQSMN